MNLKWVIPLILGLIIFSVTNFVYIYLTCSEGINNEGGCHGHKGVPFTWYKVLGDVYPSSNHLIFVVNALFWLVIIYTGFWAYYKTEKGLNSTRKP
jgi:hypothetical protein